MAVADSYDAMISDRPYRKGMDPAEAMRRLEKGAGTQFNSEVVSYFLALLNFTPQENSPLVRLVHEARQKVGANMLRTPGVSSMAGAEASAPGPARRGPERLELGLDGQ